MARAKVPHLAPVPDDNVRDLAILGAGASRAGYREVPVEQLHPHPKNPRRLINETEPEFVELVDSIRAHGILQPGVVVPDPGDPDRYLVITGHRRTAAARVAGLETVPVIVNPDLDDVAQLEAMLIENIARKDLSAVEEADGYQGLLDLGHTVDDVARKTGRSASTIRRRLQVGHLPEPARAAVHEHRATLDDALTLADLDVDDETREALADKLGTVDFNIAMRQQQQERERRENWEKVWTRVREVGAEIVDVENLALIDQTELVRIGEIWSWVAEYDLKSLEQYIDRVTVAARVAHGAGWQGVHFFRPATPEEKARREVGAAATADREEQQRAEEERRAREAAEWAQFAEVSADLRRVFLRGLIDGSPVGKAKHAAVVTRFVADYLVDQLVVFDRTTSPFDYNEPDAIARWLGVTLPEIADDEDDSDLDDVMDAALQAASEAREPWQTLLAALAVRAERVLAERAWWPADASPYQLDSGYTAVATRWYALLEELGYMPSTVEREHLTPPAPEPEPDVVDDATNDTDHDEEA